MYIYKNNTSLYLYLLYGMVWYGMVCMYMLYIHTLKSFEPILALMVLGGTQSIYSGIKGFLRRYSKCGFYSLTPLNLEP